MKHMALIIFILFGFVSGAGALPSAPKVKSCGTFLGAAADGLREIRSNPDQLATAYVKVLEWLLEKKLVTIKEAQKTISKVSPSVPEYYTGGVEDYFAANKALNMLIAQMAGPDISAWRTTQVKARNLLKSLETENKYKQEAKKETRTLFLPRVIDSIDLNEIVKSTARLKDSKFLVAKSGQIAWVAQHENGHLSAGINHQQVKLPLKSRSARIFDLFELKNGHIALAVAWNAGGFLVDKISVYDLSQPGKNPIFERSTSIKTAGKMVVWQNSHDQIQVSLVADYYKSQSENIPEHGLFTFAESGEIRKAELPKNVTFYTYKIWSIELPEGAPHLAIHTKENQSNLVIIINAENMKSVAKLSIPLSKNDSLEFEKVGNLNSKLELFIVIDPSSRDIFVYNPRHSNEFVKFDKFEEHWKAMPSFIIEEDGQLVGFSAPKIDSFYKRALYGWDGSKQEMAPSKFLGINETLMKLQDSRYGSMYVQHWSNFLEIDGESFDDSQRFALLPDTKTLRHLEMSYRKTSLGEVELIVHNKTDQLIYIYSFDSELNE